MYRKVISLSLIFLVVIGMYEGILGAVPTKRQYVNSIYSQCFPSQR